MTVVLQYDPSLFLLPTQLQLYIGSGSGQCLICTVMGSDGYWLRWRWWWARTSSHQSLSWATRVGAGGGSVTTILTFRWTGAACHRRSQLPLVQSETRHNSHNMQQITNIICPSPSTPPTAIIVISLSTHPSNHNLNKQTSSFYKVTLQWMQWNLTTLSQLFQNMITLLFSTTK